MVRWITLATTLITSWFDSTESLAFCGTFGVSSQSLPIAHVSLTSHRQRLSRHSSATHMHANDKNSRSSLDRTTHIVQGVQCRQVFNDLPIIGKVVVLEATADAQEELVEECLELEEEVSKEDSRPKRIAEGDPYGAVLWPAAWAVANYILSEPDLSANLKSSSILELGTGTGLVSIASALGGAKRVLSTDYEPLALELTRYAAIHLNPPRDIGIDKQATSIDDIIETRLLDLCALEEHPLPIHANDGKTSVDIVIAADIMYEPKTGIAMAHRAVEALRQNCRVIVGDSPGRPGRPAFLKTLRELGVDETIDFEETIGKTCSGPRHDLICGKGSTSVSEIPQELSVALLDLKPSMLKKGRT